VEPAKAQQPGPPPEAANGPASYSPGYGGDRVEITPQHNELINVPATNDREAID